MPLGCGALRPLASSPPACARDPTTKARSGHATGGRASTTRASIELLEPKDSDAKHALQQATTAMQGARIPASSSSGPLPAPGRPETGPRSPRTGIDRPTCIPRDPTTTTSTHLFCVLVELPLAPKVSFLRDAHLVSARPIGHGAEVVQGRRHDLCRDAFLRRLPDWHRACVVCCLSLVLVRPSPVWCLSCGGGAWVPNSILICMISWRSRLFSSYSHLDSASERPTGRQIRQTTPASTRT